jgi:ATP-dependent DNA ligase
MKSTFDPCIPTRATKVPTGKDWLHEIKQDGYRNAGYRYLEVRCLGRFSAIRSRTDAEKTIACLNFETVRSG